jgi:hypothetical protein
MFACHMGAGCGACLIILRKSHKTKGSIMSLNERLTVQDRLVVISVKETGSDKEIYDAVRWCWKLKADRAAEADYVLARNGDRVVGVYVADAWLPANDKVFAKYHSGDVPEDRYGFVGWTAPEDAQEKYNNKLLPEGFVKKGAANPVRFLGPDNDDIGTSEQSEEPSVKHLYRMTFGVQDGLELEGEELFDVCAREIVRHGALLQDVNQNEPIEHYYIFLNKGDAKLALRVGIKDDVDLDSQADALAKTLASDYSKTDLLGDEGFEEVTIGFEASETEHRDLWSWEFNRYAQNFEGDIKIIGIHSLYGDFAIQQWGGGEYDEGVESNADQALEYYVGLHSGESLKHERLSESDFDLSQYKVVEAK